MPDTIRFKPGDRVLVSTMHGASAVVWCEPEPFRYLVRWESSDALCVRLIPAYQLTPYDGPPLVPDRWVWNEGNRALPRASRAPAQSLAEPALSPGVGPGSHQIQAAEDPHRKPAETKPNEER